MPIIQSKIDAVTKAVADISASAGKLSVKSSPSDVAAFNSLVAKLDTAGDALAQ